MKSDLSRSRSVTKMAADGFLYGGMKLGQALRLSGNATASGIVPRGDENISAIILLNFEFQALHLKDQSKQREHQRSILIHFILL